MLKLWRLHESLFQWTSERPWKGAVTASRVVASDTPNINYPNGDSYTGDPKWQDKPGMKKKRQEFVRCGLCWWKVRFVAPVVSASATAQTTVTKDNNNNGRNGSFFTWLATWRRWPVIIASPRGQLAEAIGTTGRVSNAIGYRHDRSGLQHR